MAKNLRQKYKDAKKQIHDLKWRLLYPAKPIKLEVNNVSIRKLRSVQTVDIFEAEHMREIVKNNIAFELAKHMVQNNMINVSETVDPYSGRVYMFAEIDVVDRRDA